MPVWRGDQARAACARGTVCQVDPSAIRLMFV